jgi:hypothetical protein
MAIKIYNKVDGIEFDSGTIKYYISNKNIKLKKSGDSFTIYDDSNTSVALGQRAISFNYQDVLTPSLGSSDLLYEELVGYLDGTSPPTSGGETVVDAILNTSMNSNRIEFNTNSSDVSMNDMLCRLDLIIKYLKKIYNPE